MKGTKTLTRILSIIGALSVGGGIFIFINGITGGPAYDIYVGIGSIIGGFLIYAINEIIVLLDSINSKLNKT